MTASTMHRATRSTVLLVGARDQARELLIQALRAAGPEVELADSAAECIRVVRHVAPSMIVMDRDLVDGDGWELVRVLKTLSSTRSVPVVGVTSDGGRRNEARAVEVGCDALLVSPFASDALVRLVRRLLPALASIRIDG